MLSKIKDIFRRAQDRFYLNRKTFILYTVLRALVIVSAVRCFIEGNFESFVLCLFSLFLFLLPSFFAEALKVNLPPLFERLIYLFIYAAEILGEVNHYYTQIPGWDTLLHTINGFLCAAIGFSLVDVLNRKSKRISLSPLYLAIVAFCFSMTVGVVWEFIEFACDQFFYLDMQKDFLVQNIGSVALDPTNTQTPLKIFGITKTIIETSSGATYTIDGGYLDIGIIDTMKDLLVNFVGALTFSILGFFYVHNRGKKDMKTAKLTESLLIKSMTDEELEEQKRQIEQRKEEVAKELETRRLLP